MRGRPVVEHLLERLLAAPCDEVRVVTRPDKSDLRAHLARRDVVVVLGTPPDVASSLLLGIAGLADDDVVLVGFPDTLWTPSDGFRRLLTALVRDRDVDVVLGLFTLPDVHAADEVHVDRSHLVTRVVPKPASPTSSLTWGCLAARCRTLSGLAQVREPGELWDALARGRPGSVRAVDLGSDFLDIGTPEGLSRA